MVKFRALTEVPDAMKWIIDDITAAPALYIVGQ